MGAILKHYMNGVTIVGQNLRASTSFCYGPTWRSQFFWNYWSKNHGKGPADGVIGRVSQFMRSAIARGKASISHGMDMVFYLQLCLGTSDFNPEAKKCQHVRQNFVFVDKIDCTPNKVKVKTLSGMRNFHCIKNTGSQGVLQVWKSSCMCRFSSWFNIFHCKWFVSNITQEIKNNFIYYS